MHDLTDDRYSINNSIPAYHLKKPTLVHLFQWNISDCQTAFNTLYYIPIHTFQVYVIYEIII